MSAATITLLGDEMLCAVQGGPEARFPIADASAKLKGWAQRYDAASWRDNEGELAAIGAEMFAWLDSTNRWATDWVTGSRDRVLEVRVDGTGTDAETALLDAPWELLVGPGGPLAADSLRPFVPYRRIGKLEAPLPAEVGDLRVMFMAASPGDAGDLDFEAEETAILDATERLPLYLTVEETGALEFLSDRLSTEGPFEVLHLSCHGTIDLEAGPALVLEDAAGERDLAGPDRIADALGAKPPALLFLSACRTAEHGRADGGTLLRGYRDEEPRRDAGAAPLPAVPLARRMAEAVANVVGWDGSVYDVDATAFAHHFYRELARAVPVPRAAALARKHLLDGKAKAGGGRHWHLARVYVGAGGGGPLCDSRKPKRPMPPLPEKDFLDRDRKDVPVAGRREFVGRRRAIQALLRAYRGGTFGALIHGMGALGKSSLAARAVSRMPTLAPVVVFKRYDALAVFDRIAGRLPPTLRQNEAARWREQVGRDVSLLADALESWLLDLFAERPILLIIDDLERTLEAPSAGDASVPVKSEFRPVIAAVLTAFSRAAGASRLLLTSRYDFQLLDNLGDDLAASLARVPLQAMKPLERNKQWRAASRIVGREDKLTERAQKLQERALVAASGNPGLQATLTKPVLAGELDIAETAVGQIESFLRNGVPPAEIEAALKSGQANDWDNAVVAFFRRLSFDTYRRALNDDQARQMTAAAFFSPEVPIPVAALAATGAALGVEDAEAAITRVVGLGLLDDFGEVGAHRHAAINPLARPLTTLLNVADAPRLARAAVPELTAAWWKNSNFPADPQGLEVARLSLIGGADPVVLEDSVLSGAAWLARMQNQTRSAFDLIATARDALPHDHAYRPEFLRLAVECARTLGEGRFQDWAVGAPLRPYLPSDARARTPYAAFDLRRAETFVQRGNPEMAELLIRKAWENFHRADDQRMTAMAAGQIADMLHARGELDEALRIRRDDVLPVYERLGDASECATTMSKIADVLQARGELDEALRIRRDDVLPVYERLGNVRERAITMSKIVDFMEARGDQEEALRIRRDDILPVFEHLGDVRERAVTMCKIADVLHARGELDEALRIRRDDVLPVFERLGDVRERAVTMGQIADVLQARGELDEALRIRREEELPVYERLGDVRSRAVTMGQIADVLKIRGELDEALRIRIEEQLPIFERLGDVRSKSITLQAIATALLEAGGIEQGRIQEIHEALAESFAIAIRIGNPDGIGAVGVQFAQVLAVGSLLVEALTVLDQAEAALLKLGRADIVEFCQQLRKQISVIEPAEEP